MCYLESTLKTGIKKELVVIYQLFCFFDSFEFLRKVQEKFKNENANLKSILSYSPIAAATAAERRL